jgi:hypothetical protein
MTLTYIYGREAAPNEKVVPLSTVEAALAASEAARAQAEAAKDGAPAPATRSLTFDDALRIARGCTDYGGGHRHDPREFEVYQHGIQTVINALTAASERGLADTHSSEDGGTTR